MMQSRGGNNSDSESVRRNRNFEQEIDGTANSGVLFGKPALQGVQVIIFLFVYFYINIVIGMMIFFITQLVNMPAPKGRGGGGL